MNYLTLAAIAKDETRTLREWVAYHALVGVEAFVIYDNESATPIRETLAPFLRDGFVTVVDIPGRNMQLPAYDHALREFGPNTRWMGFIDLDEFLVPVGQNDVRHVLVDYEEHAGLAVNWATYGSSGHERRPHGLMIENYTRRLPLHDDANFHVKSLVKPALTKNATSPHSFAYLPGCRCVDTGRVPVSSAFCAPRHDRLRINHYFYRSREEFDEKLRRGRADTDAPEVQHRIDAFNRQLTAACEEDACALRFAPELKALLKADDPAAIIARPRRAVAQDLPGYLEIFLDLTRVADTDRAQALLREALTRYPDSPELISLRASSLRLTGLLGMARAEAERSLALHNTAQGMAELASVCRAQGETARAAELDSFRDFLTRYGLF